MNHGRSIMHQISQMECPHRAPNPSTLRGTHKREGSDDRLAPRGCGIKCMSKPQTAPNLLLFQTCRVILSILKLEDHVSLLSISVFL